MSKPSRSGKGKTEPSEELLFVHRFVPSEVTPEPMTLLLLHGTGGDENDLLQLGRELSQSAALLSPRGRILENGAPRFFRRIAEGVFDIPDLVIRTHELAHFLDSASRYYSFDSSRLVAVGYSNGANIAASLLFLHPESLAGAVLFRPMVPFVPEERPNLSGRSVLIASGLEDQVVPRDQPEQLLDILKRSGADAVLHWEASNHSITASEVGLARKWLARLKFR